MKYFAPIALFSLVTVACSGGEVEKDYDIKSASGGVIGEVELTSLGEKGVEVEISLAGLSAGSHAMHFHEFGKCDAPDFKSAGGHYNPTNAAHGMKMEDGPHAGDMMNIMIGEDGTGELEIVNDRVSLSGDYGLPALFDADGTALIIHEKADDYKSQPSGAAGARIGCAVIK